jgi:hypothetical protein
MSVLHCDEPPKAGVNDVLTVEGHWLGRRFRVTVQKNYLSGAASAYLAEAG